MRGQEEERGRRSGDRKHPGKPGGRRGEEAEEEGGPVGLTDVDAGESQEEVPQAERRRRREEDGGGGRKRRKEETERTNGHHGMDINRFRAQAHQR